MSSKRITLVIGLILVATFAYIGYQDAVRTWQNLQNQKNQIQQLNTEYNKLDQELDHTKESKQKSQEEVQKLEEEKNKLEEQRLKLESELQARAEAKAKLAASSSRVINAATGTQTASAASVVGVITDASIKHGLNADYMIKVANCESTLNPSATNRNYYAGGGNPSGLYQYLPETWSRISSRSPYGEKPWEDVFDASTNANVTAWAFANGYSGEWACA